MHSVRLSRLLLQAVVAAMLGACAGGGGGGGGSVPVSPPPPASPPPAFPPLAPPHTPGDFPSTSGAEFTANWGVGGTNAQIAWQNGATGAGVLVGVIDDGIDPNHPELVGRISPQSTDIVAGRNALTTTLSHGSELSSLIAGNYNGSQTVGVAFDATILAVRADDGSSSFTSVDLANAIDYARTHGVDVINLSLGSSSATPSVLRNAIAQATAAGIIFVVSAGNDGTNGATDPNYPGFLATDPSVSHGLIIVAGGLNPNGSVNPVSNPPGAAANWYMTAPGWQIIVPDYGPVGAVPGFQTCGLGPNGNLCRIQGTSYASPHITGAVALVMDAFPGLTPAQVVDLLFTTADDTGPVGTDSVNGRGRLNIGRAFQPVGPLAVPLGVVEMEAGLQVGAAGPAFGDAIGGARSAWSIVGFDSYNRTFPVNLADSWLSASPGPSTVASAPMLWRNQVRGGSVTQMAMAESVAPDSLHLAVDRADLEQPATRIDAVLGAGFTASVAAHGASTAHERNGDQLMHLDAVNADVSLRLTKRVNDVVSFALISESGEAASGVQFTRSSGRSAIAARSSFSLPLADVDLTFGQLQEEHGVLGLAWNGLLGETPAGETRFAGFGARVSPLPNVELSFSAETGEATLAGSGWLSVAEPLRTSAYALEMRSNMAPRWLSGDGTLTLSIAQPLRVESGELAFMAPTATKWGRRSLAFEQRSFSAAPSGRELRFGVGYSYAEEDLSAFTEALYVTDPGHVAGAEPETVLRVGVRVAR